MLSVWVVGQSLPNHLFVPSFSSQSVSIVLIFANTERREQEPLPRDCLVSSCAVRWLVMRRKKSNENKAVGKSANKQASNLWLIKDKPTSRCPVHRYCPLISTGKAAGALCTHACTHAHTLFSRSLKGSHTDTLSRPRCYRPFLSFDGWKKKWSYCCTSGAFPAA